MTPQLYYESYLDKYKDTIEKNLPEMAKGPSNDITRLKEIESRIYVDLWGRELFDRGGNKKIETIRKITVALIKNEGNNIYKLYTCHHNEEPDLQNMIDELQLELSVDPKDSRRNIYIDFQRLTKVTTSSETSPVRKIYIPINEIQNDYIAECTLRIYSTNENIGQEKEIEVSAQLIHRLRDKITYLGNKYSLKMNLYRCSQPSNNDDPFGCLKEKDTNKDIFVMPRLWPEKKHESFIKKLQLYSNQVFARHKGIQHNPLFGQFEFVKEDGLYTDQLGKNYGMSVDVFQKTESNREVSDANNEYFKNIRTVFEYNFSTFGQEARLVEFLSSNYALDENIVRKLVIDRNFIYGATNDQSKMENIQGLKNLYEKVVNVFRQRMVEEANRYVIFPHRWMPKPDEKHNKNYHRGKLIVKSGMNLQVYNIKMGGETVQVGNVAAGCFLPENAEITFTSGHDKNCEGTDRYGVERIKIGIWEHKPQANKTWYIPLTYDIKKKCMDNKDYAQNYCDYIGTIPQDMTKADEKALKEYKYGVPYYISNPDVTGTGGKVTYNIFNERLNVKNILNWYSYDDSKPSKPNSPTEPNPNIKGGIGLDCSGLIMNCLLDIRYNRNDSGEFFVEIPLKNGNSYRSNGENVEKMGPTRTRLIPHTLVNNENTLIQSADLIYVTEGNPHIALCAIPHDKYVHNNQIPTADIEQGDFRIIHNYGGSFIKYVTNGTQPILKNFNEGFFMRTLSGPFRHWGANFGSGNTNAKAGRIYLWY
jgi:hypothetical protein